MTQKVETNQIDEVIVELQQIRDVIASSMSDRNNRNDQIDEVINELQKINDEIVSCQSWQEELHKAIVDLHEFLLERLTPSGHVDDPS